MKKAAEILGVAVITLRGWDKTGKIKAVRTPGDKRRIPESEIKRLLGNSEESCQNKILVVYGRVSSHEQKTKGDLDRQVELIKSKFDSDAYNKVLVITDVSSGLNDQRKGLLKLMQLAREQKITDIGITYRDRLTRFGFNYLTSPNGIMQKLKYPQDHVEQPFL